MRLAERVANLEVLNLLEVSKGASPDCINLTVGEPDLPPDPLVKEGIMEALDKNLTKYTPDEGILELRKAVADDLKERYGVPYDTDEIIITQGGAGAIFASLLALLNEGDKAILQSPWYSGHLRALNLLKAKAFPLKTFERGAPIDLETKDLPKDAKIIFLCSPNNPTGMVLKHEDLEKVLFFAERNDQILLIDIAYEALTENGKIPLPIEFKGGKERTVILGSFSKCYSITGLRIGYVAAPREIAVGIKKAISTFSFCANSLTQYGVLNAFKKGNPNFPSLREEFKKRRELSFKILSNGGIRVTKPEGGFFIFPYFDDGKEDIDRAKLLVEKAKVITVPGYPFFGPDGKGHLRIALTQPLEVLKSALGKIVSLLKN